MRELVCACAACACKGVCLVLKLADGASCALGALASSLHGPLLLKLWSVGVYYHSPHPLVRDADVALGVRAWRQERQQQRAYNAVVAREEAQNEQYTEDEARYRKIRAHAYLQQYQGFIRRRRHEEIFGEGGRAARHHGLPGAAGGPGQHYYH